MSTDNASPRDQKQLAVRMYLAVFGAVATAHCMLLFSEAILYNGTRMFATREDLDPARLDFHFTQLGLPWVTYYHRALWIFEDTLFAYKVGAFICVTASAVLMADVLRFRKHLSVGEAGAVAVVASIWPAYSMWFEVTMFPYSVSYLFFWIGSAAYLRFVSATVVSTTFRRVGIFAACCIIFLSFQTRSLLVFFYALLFFIAVCDDVIADVLVRRNALSALNWMKKHAVAIALPVVSFIIMKVIFPKSTGLYASYNKIQFSPRGLLWGFYAHAKRVLFEQSFDMLQTFTQHSSVLVLAVPLGIAAAAITFALLRHTSPAVTPPTRGRVLLTLLCGLVFYSAAAFPYAAVGKNPIINSFSSRHALLTGISVAVLFVLIVSPLAKRATVTSLIASLVVFLCTVTQVRNALLWETQFIKYRAVIAAIAHDAPELGSMVKVNDDNFVGMTPDPHFGYDEVTYMLSRATKTQRHFPLYKKSMTQAELDWIIKRMDKNIYMMNDAVFDGTATEIFLVPQRHPSDFSLYFEYLFAGEEERKTLLRDLLDLRYEARTVTVLDAPVPPSPATP